MSNEHEVVFRWPHPEPNTVIVSGTFNEWSRSYFHLTKGSTGFEGSVKIPWNQKIAYKFIVDGVWMVQEEHPTEPDHDGNINNIYTAPPNPSGPATQVAATEESAPKAANGDKTSVTPNGEPKAATAGSTFPQMVSDFADTVAAREGTSSAFGYVASGLGAAIHSVVGIDPINIDQIAIPTPKPDDEFEVPEEQAETSISEPESPPIAATSDAKEETVAESVAPDVPITIVPVNAPENNTSKDVSIPSPSEEGNLPAKTVVEKSPEMPVEEPTIPAEPSTHGMLPSGSPAVGDLRAEDADDIPRTQTESSKPLVAENTPASAAIEENGAPSVVKQAHTLGPVIPVISDSSPDQISASPNTEHIPREPVLPGRPEMDRTPIATTHNDAVRESTSAHQPKEATPVSTHDSSDHVPLPTSDDLAAHPSETKLDTSAEPQISVLSEKTSLEPEIATTKTSSSPLATVVESSNGSATITEEKAPQTNGHSEPTAPVVEKPTAPVAPSTPTKATGKQSFPSSSSPNSSPSSSRFGTESSRKKRTSFIGKLKQVFSHHDKDKIKEQK